MLRWRYSMAVLALGLQIAGCGPHTPSPADAGRGDVLLARCGNRAELGPAMLATLQQGHPAETARSGSCVANAAHNGSTTAALLLADAYRQTMAPYLTDTVPAKPTASSPLSLDLFGRHISWLTLAAQRGDAPAQVQLAQETDAPSYAPMYYLSLVWYQAAAENGSPLALQAIGAAYRQGRIADDRLYDFKQWLRDRAKNRPEARRMLQLLDQRPTHYRNL